MEGLSRGKKLWEKSFERTVMKKYEMSITARVRRDGLVLCQNKQFHRLDSLPPQFCFLCSRYVLFLGCSMGLCSLLSLAIGFGMMEQ